jgi:Tetracyclin repressor-like, C-terminal domain
MLELRQRCAHPDSVAPPEIPFRGILDPVARKLRLPFGTPEFIDRIIRGGVNQAGRRTLHMLITTWDATGGGPFAASAIATAGLAKTVEVAQSLFIGPVFDPLLKALGADKSTLRASLCASQIVGVGIMRYGVRVEPIHSMDVDALVDAVAPTLQRYLVGEIS